jgi:hypothetical protein
MVMERRGNRARAVGDQGVALAQLAVTKLNWAFERFDTRDRGIDACIAIADEDGRLDGRLIAAQIKGGASWLRHETAEGFTFYEDLDHFEYWMDCSLPVVILLGDTAKGVVYWVAVTPASVQRTAKGRRITVPRDQVLNESAKPKLIELARSASVESGRLLADEVHRLRERYTAGERRSARESLGKLSHGALWRFADRNVRGDAYVDLAVWSVEVAADVAAAKTYAELAEVQGAADVALARAVIAAHDKRAADVIAELGAPSTMRAYDLLIWLRLASGDAETALRTIEARPASLAAGVSAARAESLALFATGKKGAALTAIRAALDRSPGHWWLRFTMACLQLASTIASPTLEFLLATTPTVIIPATVNRDRDSVAKMREAAATFGDLENATDDDRLAAMARGWRLACLAADPDKDDATNTLIDEMLLSADTVAAAVPWALARELPFDAGEVFRRLETLLSSHPRSVLPFTAAFNVLLTR